MDILAKLRDLIVEQLEVSPDQVKEDARFQEDLGADSLDVVELVMKIEDTFGIEIPEEDAEKIRTVGDAVNYIQEKLG